MNVSGVEREAWRIHRKHQFRCVAVGIPGNHRFLGFLDHLAHADRVLASDKGRMARLDELDLTDLYGDGRIKF